MTFVRCSCVCITVLLLCSVQASAQGVDQFIGNVIRKMEQLKTDARPAKELGRPADSRGSPQPYSVAGMVLGAKLSPEEFRSRFPEGKCAASEQFANSAWCTSRDQKRESRGSYSVASTAVISADQTIAYVNQSIAPAFFEGDEISADIERLTRRWRAPAQIQRKQFAHIGVNAWIATWGNVRFVDVTDRGREAARLGNSPNEGIIFDVLGDFKRSVENNLPLFKVVSGTGFVWVASSNSNGIGFLRFFAVNSTSLIPTAETTATQQSSRSTPSVASKEIDPKLAPGMVEQPAQPVIAQKADGNSEAPRIITAGWLDDQSDFLRRYREAAARLRNLDKELPQNSQLTSYQKRELLKKAEQERYAVLRGTIRDWSCPIADYDGQRVFCRAWASDDNSEWVIFFITLSTPHDDAKVGTMSKGSILVFDGSIEKAREEIRDGRLIHYIDIRGANARAFQAKGLPASSAVESVIPGLWLAPAVEAGGVRVERIDPVFRATYKAEFVGVFHHKISTQLEVGDIFYCTGEERFGRPCNLNSVEAFNDAARSALRAQSTIQGYSRDLVVFGVKRGHPALGFKLQDLFLTRQR